MLFALAASRAGTARPTSPPRCGVDLPRTRSASSRTASTRRGRSSSVRGRDVYVVQSLLRRRAAERQRQAGAPAVLRRRAQGRRRRARDRDRPLSRLRPQGPQDQAARPGDHALRRARCSRRSAPTASSRSTCTTSPRSRTRSAAAPSTSRRRRCSSASSRRWSAPIDRRRGLAGCRRHQARRGVPRAPRARRSAGRSARRSRRSTAAAASSAAKRCVGDVAGRIAIIVDDLISAGTTVARAARACRAQGAARVLAVASHGVFAPAANAVLAGARRSTASSSPTRIPPLPVTAAGAAAQLRAGRRPRRCSRRRSGGSMRGLARGAPRVAEDGQPGSRHAPANSTRCCASARRRYACALRGPLDGSRGAARRGAGSRASRRTQAR